MAEWTTRASGCHAVAWLLSVDADDPDLTEYRALARRRGLGLLVGANRSIVDAVNAAARRCDGELLVVASDDFGCPKDWDEALVAALGDDLDRAVLVADGVEDRILTLPVLGRRFYESLGHVYHPDYVSMYADDELTEVARRRGRLVDARHLVFPHRHYSLLGTEPDATYRRQNSRRAWREGWRVYQRHRAEGFTGRCGPGAWPRIVGVEVAHGIRTLADRVRGERSGRDGAGWSA